MGLYWKPDSPLDGVHSFVIIRRLWLNTAASDRSPSLGTLETSHRRRATRGFCKERESTWVTVSFAGRHTEWTKTKKGVTARSPKVWPPLINSHSFMQTLTNQKLGKGSSWLLIGLNLHKRMCINQKRSHFWVPGCKETWPITADTCLSQKAAHLTWPDLIPFLLRTQLFEGWLAITQG